MLERLKILQADRSRFSNGREAASCLLSDKALRQEVEILTKAFFNTSVSGCGDCYAEAYTKLMNLNLKTAMEKIECQFVLGAGRLLQDINDRTKTCSQANITTELALYHLSKNPNEINKFVKFPKDWEQQVENFKSAKPEENLEQEATVAEEPTTTKEDVPEATTEEVKFSEAEETLISEIQTSLAAGTSKTDIKAKYSQLETVGEKKLTGVLLSSLIKEATARAKA